MEQPYKKTFLSKPQIIYFELHLRIFVDNLQVIQQ